MKDIRVLLIEDDQFLRRACEVSLKKRGFTVMTAVDGEEGLQQARTATPDIILLDMLMPKLSGLDTLKRLKNDERTQRIPVVILSNSAAESNIQKASELGAAGYIVKASISLRELGDRVVSYIHSADR
ncbi:MAG: response regulator [Acidobacteria bacterium]|nr:response regulator [Acidobacteriota bacterium]